jgi:putative RecB family exonuclease
VRLTGNRRLSVSAYWSYLSCPKRYEFNYVERVPRPDFKPPEHWRFGTVVHAGLEAAYKVFQERELTGRLTQVEPSALAAVRASWEEELMPTRGGELDRALGIVSGTLDKLVEHHENVLGVEELLLGHTPGGIPFVGYADLIRRADAVTVEIRDYKVTAKTSTAKELQVNPQGNLYAMICREKFPWAERILFSHLYPNHGAKLVQTSISAESMEAVIDKFEAVGDAINLADDFPAKPGEHCGWCAYNDICPAWEEARRSDDLTSMVNF